MINVIKLESKDKARGIVYKFECGDSKYRVRQYDDFFIFEYAKKGPGRFYFAKSFKDLEIAKKFIYNQDCP